MSKITIKECGTSRKNEASINIYGIVDFTLTIDDKSYRFSASDGNLVLPEFDFSNMKPCRDYNGNVAIKIIK